MKNRLREIGTALTGSFVFFTGCWALWGHLTPGDYFANGSRWLMPSLAITTLAGAAAGWQSRAMALRMGWLIFMGLALAFWLCVPDGWWAHEPA